jgi:divalent metal cation (Fe/Co/Zn/Cd) transporter
MAHNVFGEISTPRGAGDGNASGATLLMLYLAAQPPDDEHAFGHDKAEFLAAGLKAV